MKRITVTSGHPMAPEEKQRALAYLGGQATMAEQNALPRTAKSWRDAAENLRHTQMLPKAIK
jgi:hypothetical protein